MPYTPGRIIRRFDLPNGHWIELVARHDGHFEFHERAFMASKHGLAAYLFSSPVYVSAATAEAAARKIFKL